MLYSTIDQTTATLVHSQRLLLLYSSNISYYSLSHAYFKYCVMSVANIVPNIVTNIYIISLHTNDACKNASVFFILYFPFSYGNPLL